MRRSIASARELGRLDRSRLAGEPVDPAVAVAHGHEHPVGRLGMGDRSRWRGARPLPTTSSSGAWISAVAASATAPGPDCPIAELLADPAANAVGADQIARLDDPLALAGRAGARAPRRRAARTRRAPSPAPPGPRPAPRSGAAGSARARPASRPAARSARRPRPARGWARRTGTRPAGRASVSPMNPVKRTSIAASVSSASRPQERNSSIEPVLTRLARGIGRELPPCGRRPATRLRSARG